MTTGVDAVPAQHDLARPTLADAFVADGGRTILTFGSKGAGKTTTALALAARYGLGLLANDHVFVRINKAGGVDVLPWPAAAALGLGLLDGLNWFDIARERLRGGESLRRRRWPGPDPPGACPAPRRTAVSLCRPRA